MTIVSNAFGQPGDPQTPGTQQPGTTITPKDSLFVMITGIEEELDRSINVYPNPAHEAVTIDGDFDEATLIDPYGRPVASGKQITLNEVKAGLYIVRIRKQNTVVSRKLIVN